MNTLAELQSLVSLARRFGQEPAPVVLKQIEVLQREEQRRLQREAEIKQRITQDLTELFNIKEAEHELVQSSAQSPASGPEQPDIGSVDARDQVELREDTATDAAETTAQRVARVISETGVVAPDPVLAQPQRDLEREIRYLREWVGRIAATGPGSGEVNLRYLDDVNRSTIDHDLYLRYDAPTKKFVFDHGHVNNFYLQAQSMITQTSSATSATAVSFEITDFSDGIYVDGANSSRLVLTHAGSYNLQFSAQVTNAGNTPDQLYIWLAQNSQDIENSTGIITVPAKDNANTPGATIASWNYVFSTQTSNEFVQLKWFVDDSIHTTLTAFSSIAATASTPRIPAAASIIVTITTVEIY